ncbi:MAG: FkbM family methyltransferase [Sulfuricurvum sp.]|uniref:FkbM family methyltransferase n=1 Tax=Sulfuricurvum sp. TaxID=2025608 RepID=UPI002735BD58|nr:FkbM family methyltransferase [Sulfuricurvum sp.]MDP3290525.1 FkbM family methyltransferase [Sulfuricurvum sp.]
MKKFIKSNHKLYKIYQKIRYSKSSNIRSAFEKVNEIILNNNYNSFIFDGENTWLKVFDDIEYMYVPDKFGGLLGLEKKDGFESIEIEFVKNNLKDGDTFIDIGANFGLYSIFVGKKFKNCAIHSFEPVPETFKILSKNLKHNGLNEKNSTNNIGLADKKGKLFFSNDKYAGNHIIVNPKKSDSVTEIDVEILDDYIINKNIDKVDFIKCDVEGAELLVLIGAKEVIEKYHPIILIEIYEDWTKRFGHSAMDVINYLLSFGYKVKMINHQSKKIENFDSSKLNIVYDFIFYTNEIII